MIQPISYHFPILAIIVLFFGAFLATLCGSRYFRLRNTIMCLSIFASLAMVLYMFKPVVLEGQILTYWLGGRAPVNDFAIGISLQVDALSWLFGFIAVFSLMLSAIYSLRYLPIEHNMRPASLDKYYILFMMLGGGVLGLIFAADLFNIFVMVEIMTLAAVGLTAFRILEAPALEAAFKYLVIGAIGSAFILLGTILIYQQTHTLSLAQIAVLLDGNINPPTIFAFALLVAGFAIKSFVFPFHTVAADAYSMAFSSASMLFSSIVNKAGIYALIRILYTVYQAMDQTAIQYFLVIIGTLTMFIGVTMALSQHDFKRLLAFHSVSQMGYVLTAIGLATSFGLSSGLYHALNHSLFKGLLFLAAGTICARAGTTDLDNLGGLARKMPQTTIVFLIGAFSISGLPPFNGFASKWMIYQATFQKAAESDNIFFAVVTIIALIVSVMTLASFIKVSQSVFFGQRPEACKEALDPPASMLIPMWIMAIACVLGGIFPQYLSQYLFEPAVEAIYNVGDYVGAAMGADYAARVGSTVVNVPQIDYVLAGYWSPIAWLVLFVVIMVAFLIVFAGKTDYRPVLTESATPIDDPKYDTFFSGEASEHSQVGGSDLFWGLKHNLKPYFSFMDKFHSGVLNDYVLWTTIAVAVFAVFSFLALGGGV